MRSVYAVLHRVYADILPIKAFRAACPSCLRCLGTFIPHNNSVHKNRVNTVCANKLPGLYGRSGHPFILVSFKQQSTWTPFRTTWTQETL